MKSKRTKACDISSKERAEVIERDQHCCIFCGNENNISIAHMIPRSSGGLGIKENLGCVCFNCHYIMDHTTKRKEYIEKFRSYLDEIYQNCERIYKKVNGKAS